MTELKTLRAKGVATVTVDHVRCSSCGLCARVCKGQPLYMEDGKVMVDQNRIFGCMACGHCMAVCPRDCIKVNGRDLVPEDMVTLPSYESRANYDSLQALMLARRSVREFRKREVERDTIDKIIAVAATAPMGIPPTDVAAFVIAGHDKVKAFKDDLLASFKKMRWLFTPPMLWLMRLFVHKEEYEMLKSFIVPVIDIYDVKDREGEDYFLYDAPLMIFFYSSLYSDPVDPTIAATYAMLAGESLGLGSCMIGCLGVVIQNDAKLRQKYGLPAKLRPGVGLIFGYPEIRYQHAVRRTLANVHFH